MVEIFQNIRQPYDFVLPCEELAPYVEFFSQSARPSLARTRPQPPAYSSSKMFASWTPTCYINLGPAYVIDLGHKRYTVRAGEDVLLLRNTTIARHKLATDNIFTLKFYPGGLEAVLGINQVPLTDQLLPLTHVLPAALLAQVKQPLSFAERVGLLERFLLAAFRRPFPPDHYVRLVHDAIGEYQAAGLQLSTSAVAERLFLTSKTINRYFHRVVGTSSSQYFALLRARTALTAFVAHPQTFDPSDYGYYDRSHFAKAARQFTGLPLATSGH
ncbi:helix-turn-helix domain-containing protein [Hymenobacter negativus]|uniref:AraC family transcriptional regulator n=1 Tax=Hymenobacter negativus TaxID=2795026 RepID=A0ABS3QIW3_9BACT|nr:helix-turn-helix domain-containing protein [Hymenobacter negativus]MBO2011179.1 AraC family transcriptional regulator [Hymenobacter negativus]